MRTYIIKNRRNKFIIGHNGMYKVFCRIGNCLKGSLTSIWLDKWTYAPDAFKDGYQKAFIFCRSLRAISTALSAICNVRLPLFIRLADCSNVKDNSPF